MRTKFYRYGKEPKLFVLVGFLVAMMQTPSVAAEPLSSSDIPGCPYSSPIVTPGTYTLNVEAQFGQAGIVNWTSMFNAIACAKHALGQGPGGNDVTVVLELPASNIDLSTTINPALKGSIDVSNINCVAPKELNCGNKAGQATNTTNQLIFKGAGPSQTSITFILDQTNHANDLIGIFGHNTVNVEFTGMTFIYEAMTVTQGTVVSSTNTSVILDIFNGFPNPSTLLDLIHFPSSGRFLRVFELSKQPNNPISDCSIIQDPMRPDGSVKMSQITWGLISEPDLGLKQLSSESPNRWFIPFSSAQKKAPYEQGQILGIKSKQGVNSYQFNNSANITFNQVAWQNHSRGVFGGSRINGIKYGTLNVKVIDSSIVPQPPIQSIMPCMSTPDGGPQLGGQLGFPSSGHVITGNHFISLGDDPIALFDVTNSTVTNNNVPGSFSGRGVNFSFSVAPTAPIDAPTSEGGAGINFCNPPNKLNRDILEEIASGINKEGDIQIFCPQ